MSTVAYDYQRWKVIKSVITRVVLDNLLEDVVDKVVDFTSRVFKGIFGGSSSKPKPASENTVNRAISYANRYKTHLPYRFKKVSTGFHGPPHDIRERFKYVPVATTNSGHYSVPRYWDNPIGEHGIIPLSPFQQANFLVKEIRDKEIEDYDDYLVHWAVRHGITTYAELELKANEAAESEKVEAENTGSEVSPPAKEDPISTEVTPEKDDFGTEGMIPEDAQKPVVDLGHVPPEDEEETGSTTSEEESESEEEEGASTPGSGSGTGGSGGTTSPPPKPPTKPKPPAPTGGSRLPTTVGGWIGILYTLWLLGKPIWDSIFGEDSYPERFEDIDQTEAAAYANAVNRGYYDWTRLFELDAESARDLLSWQQPDDSLSNVISGSLDLSPTNTVAYGRNTNVVDDELSHAPNFATEVRVEYPFTHGG